MKRTNVTGVVLNALALLMALCSAPVVVKVAFAGLLISPPLLALAMLVAAVGPVVGLVLSFMGRARGVALGTGVAALLVLVASFGVLSAAGQSPLDERGHTSGPKPSGCEPKSLESAAIGRRCTVDAGTEPAGDCPPQFFCMERVQMRPDSLECRLYCRHDCECPDGFSCVFEHCQAR
ncbi:MAG: hypothetical protein JNK82_20195 [Myxococcaceae bacterium]|nr:hypothetical protein [Myxococcaceae bacterium]